MKFTILGSSHGVPEKNRKCSCVMVEINENRYFLDMGMDAISALRDREIPVDSVKGVFCSHMHGDHTDGLIPFVDLLNWYFTKAEPKILLPKAELIDGIKAWCSIVEGGNSVRENIFFDLVRPGVIFDDGTLRVTAFPTLHCEASFALLLEAEGKRVLYTGDLNASLKDFPQEVINAGLDLMICEGAHFSPMQYVPLVKGKAVKQIVWTHHYTPQEAFFEEFCQAMAPIPVAMSFDGQEVEL